MSQDERDELFRDLAMQVIDRYTGEYVASGLLYGRSNPILISECGKTLNWLAKSIYSEHAELHRP